jgi:hypothetical protein
MAIYRVNNLVDDLLARWHNASPTDFGALALAVIVTAWFISKYCNN